MRAPVVCAQFSTIQCENRAFFSFEGIEMGLRKIFILLQPLFIFYGILCCRLFGYTSYSRKLFIVEQVFEKISIYVCYFIHGNLSTVHKDQHTLILINAF